ncbi:MAG: ATP-binding cassette domain-containing protein [Bacteroidia bacterium]
MTEKNQVVLKIEGLHKSFGSKNILIDFNLELLKGENIVVIGKSGSGKSVLIKCVVGLLKPDKGNILVFGTNMQKMNQDELDRLRVKIGFLFQNSALYDSMTVQRESPFRCEDTGWISVAKKKNCWLMKLLKMWGYYTPKK